MWKTLAQLWVSISLMLETINSGTRTVNNLVTTAEAHSDHFKSTSMSELDAKRAEVEAKAKARIVALKEAQA